MSKSHYLCAASALCLGLLIAGSAQAQSTAQPGRAAAAGNEVEEVVVTGSFIAGTPEDAAIPVEAVTMEELRRAGSPSNLDLVKGLSEVGGVAGEANRSNLFAVGSQSVNLRALSSSRTVVVFNGRRFPEQFSSSVGRFNNTALIPNAALGRIEILKDGGATTYGADAVGGVVNYITRKNLDGIETNANYRYIDDSDGDWDGDISLGKVGDNWNAMLVVGYQHRSEVDTQDRDFALNPYLISPAGFSGYGQPGSYLFQRAGQAGVITPSATAASGNHFDGNVQMGSTGIIRDPNCTALGGFAGWSATPSPLCYFPTARLTNVVEQQDTWQVYGEANYEVNDYLKFHVEGLYYQLDVPHIPLDTFVSVPLVFPLTSTGASQNIGGSSSYAVAGGNPAVRTLLGTIRNADGSLAFGNPDTPGTQAFQIVNGGRVGLPSAAWRPWGVGGPPVPELEQQHNTNVTWRISAELSGDIPEFSGFKLKWSLAGTFNHIAYDLDFNDIMVDRLQAALNGFGGAGCTGATPGANGCQYFNPFPSAYDRNVYTGETNPAFVGTGTFAGYSAGQGLQNNTDLVKWLYAPIFMHRLGEYSIYDFLVSGETPLMLPGGPVEMAAGAQYRYYREESNLSNLGDRALNPCATPGVLVCATASGPGVFSRASGVSGLGFDYDRRYPVAAGFFEFRAPILDTLTANVSGRYEKFFSDVSDKDTSIFVPAGSLRWQATDWLAFRGTAAKSFSQVNPPAPRAPTTAANNPSPALLGGTSVLFTSASYPNLDVKPERGFNYNVGTIVSIGNFRANLDYYHIKIKDISRAQTAGQLVSALVQPGQTGPGALINCSSQLLTENQELLGGRPFVQLNGPCTATSALNSPNGGGGIGGTGVVNFFGQQGTQTFLVNGGTLTTSGIDFSANYRVDDVLGGELGISFDWTHILTYEAGDYIVGGVTVAAGYSGVGKLNELTGRNLQHVFEDRFSLGFNFTRGRHNINLSTRFTSALINDDTADFAENGLYNANIGANGVVPTGAACIDNSPVSPPVPAGSGTGQTGANTGATVGYCAGQNVSILTGLKLPATFQTDLSYQLTLPWDTTLTLTVQNLFGNDPEFSRDVLGYDASTGSPLGRTFRLGVRKRW